MNLLKKLKQLKRVLKCYFYGLHARLCRSLYNNGNLLILATFLCVPFEPVEGSDYGKKARWWILSLFKQRQRDCMKNVSISHGHGVVCRVILERWDFWLLRCRRRRSMIARVSDGLPLFEVLKFLRCHFWLLYFHSQRHWVAAARLHMCALPCLHRSWAFERVKCDSLERVW